MANFVYIATSLDGYIATANGGIDWLTSIPNPSGSDYGYADFMTRVDAILLGRHTFEKVLSFGEWFYSKPVFVLSKQLQNLPEHLHGKAELINGIPLDIQNRLHAKGYRNLYIDGGKVIQTFLADDLVDELIITRVPKILGEGIPLFGYLSEIKEFAHIETEVLNDYLVKSRYSKAPKLK